MELTDQRAAVGEPAKFVCKFTGTPRPGRYITIPPNEILNMFGQRTEPNTFEMGKNLNLFFRDFLVSQQSSD